MEVPPDASLTTRLGARLSPEVLASILAVPVVIAAFLAFVVLRGSGQPSVVPPPAAVATPTAPASTGPTPAAPTPAASTPAASASAPSPTPDTATARIVLQLVDELLGIRQDLAAAAAPRRPDPQQIADQLRTVNATLVTLEQPLADLRNNQRTADIGTRLTTVADATRDAVTETQRASITNVVAYKAGGLKVVDVMEPLLALRAELATLAGPPAASP
jgi:hypothetical protein